MVEAEAIQAAVLTCIDKGFESVQIESDSKCLVDMLNGKTQLDVVIEGILFYVQWLKQQLRSIEVIFAHPVCNKTAHPVASFVTREWGFHNWDGLEPESLFNILASDVNIYI
ncbi:hypothetical protein DVH24_025560 [Malus domestica]|uniref:RNase H type-1 domain-containing protein n=1 Tax=Malus domestica TaxID=3750 RepID=A0A498HM88_MALDO|nr:hypothetical protein DVH24_025560 [Malus domestica]